MLPLKIEQTNLLRLARDYAARQATARPSLRCAVLTGSVARGEPPLGDAVDLDILMVDDSVVAPQAELARLSDFVFVDALIVPPTAYADRKAVRVHHHTGPMINSALLLYDPRHYFDILQASVRAPYSRADHIYARARSAQAAAVAAYEPLAAYCEDPAPEPLPIDLLMALHDSLYLSACAVVLLMAQPDSTGPRKMMVRFEGAARQLWPELYGRFLGALGVAGLSPAEVEPLFADWLTQYKAASKRGTANPLIHPLKRGYYERGIRALIAEGHAINTLWLMEHTFAACVRDLSPFPAEWTQFLQTTGKASGAEFSRRVQETEAFLALVDETLVNWAKRESVEW
nr:hypothetical protein [Chloroflexota bacterium]